ncbi:MAG: NAD(P)-binding domain-containing protein [Nitrospinota bacterium]
MPETSVGFIGLGLMGRPMARRLMAEGYPVAVANRSRPAVDALAAEGAVPCESPADVADRSEVVFTMLPDAPDVEAVVFGAGGLAASMRAGSVLIDSTSNHPGCAERVAEALVARGAQMLDAPVSGAPEGAEQGTLAIMVGGPKAVFERCRPILETLGAKVVHVGEAPGSGCIAKLANQILVGVTFLGVAEALVFGAKAGLDPATLVDAMGAGLARCGALEVKAPKILSGDFAPGGKVMSHMKDLRYAMEKALELNVPLLGTALVAQMFSELQASGEGDLDHIAIIKSLERMAGVEARARK